MQVYISYGALPESLLRQMTHGAHPTAYLHAKRPQGLQKNCMAQTQQMQADIVPIGSDLVAKKRVKPQREALKREAVGLVCLLPGFAPLKTRPFRPHFAAKR